MVMLRSSVSGTGGATDAVALAPILRDSPTTSLLETTADFLSLETPARSKANRGSGGSRAPVRSSGSFSDKEESYSEHTLRTLRKRPGIGLPSSFDKSIEMPSENNVEGKHFTRRLAKLQADTQKNGDCKEDEVVAPVARPLRRTRNSEKAAENPENGDVEVRRSCRIRRSRYSTTNQSVLFDKLITNTAEAVLQKMDDMKKMRRLRMRELDDPGDFNDTEEENLEIYSRAKQKRDAQQTDEETTDNQDESGESSEEGEDQDDEDAEEDNQKRYDFRQRKTIVRYQAPLKEPRQQRKQKMFYNGPTSPVRRRYRFTSAAPRSPYCKRRINRRRHAIHNSDSTSSSSSSDDEQCFERCRNRNRNKVLSRCLPLNLRREDLKGIHKDRMKIGASLADVDPMQMDSSVRFDSVGGLSNHIAALKEMVVFPLLYPEVFERFKIQPPRGCLFYGPPGTGKTLVARALSNECSQGDRRVAFFMRKGADCLSKWVGESERQLRLLFDQAYQMRPSIIFFDEIDGLAPVRSSRQDQIHSSIVSTLLALMDGLDSRGEIVVIGATNRLDSIDPALRRPGRFDREFLFSLPDKDARKEILKIHMRDWNPKPSDTFVEELGEKCVGYCGADIKFVCTEAALCALRRRYPQIYTSSQKLQLDVSSIKITAKDFVVAMQKIVPASQRAVVSPGQALSSVTKPLLQNTLNKIMDALQRIFPHAEQSIKKGENCGQSYVSDLMYSDDEGPSVFENGLNTLNKQKENMPFLQFNRHACHQPTSYRPRLLITGEPGMGQGSHLAPAVLHTLEKFTVHTLDLAVLFGVSATSPEETCAQLFHEAKRTAPSILYIPHVHLWWDIVGCTLTATFITLIKNIPSFTPILLLATCDVSHKDLPEEVQELFESDYEEVFHVHPPSSEERRMFFEDLILNQSSKPPASKKKAVLQALEVLPLASPPEPRQLTAEELKRLEEQEEDTLRELRLFLRDVTHRLAIDKRFRAFTKPVDLEEVPDYVTVIAQPMDLSTVISKIDLHKYQMVKDYLKDIDLICSNALEYNPDRDPADRLIRHRACTLRDTAYAIIKAELDEDFEKLCEEIQASRKKRGCFSSKYVPSYYYVLPKHNTAECKKLETERSEKLKMPAMPVAASTPSLLSTAKKRSRRKSRWSSGTIAKRKKMPQTNKDDKIEEGDEAESDGVESLENQDSSLDQTEMEVNGDSSMDAETENVVLEKLASGSESNSKTDKEDAVLSNSIAYIKNYAMNETAKSELPRRETEMENRETSNLQMENIAQNGDAKDVCVFHMTRARHSQVEQQHIINVEKAMEILSEPTPPFYVDHQQLKKLLKKITEKSQGYNIFHLEKLYALLSQCIYRHRKDYDKTQLTQEMEREIENFRVSI
ncbi:ATPase family AAA domain-containing protein 2 [Rhinatrema bivittatum]|uniref:ATPase family AAA domain-containing protein 2 n=1 Tax=Rhinatrema bivittatum TaxID=194408 RepID=UPI001126432F|nr:ATPase family AAA domain-containing protein 2 [Rhinatrema bivittatum]